MALKIKSKVFLSIVLLLLVSVLPLCLMGLYFMYHQSAEALLGNNRDILSGARSRIEAYFGEIDILGRTLAYNTTIQTALVRNFESLGAYEEYITNNYVLNVLKLYQLQRKDIRVILCSVRQPDYIYTLYANETLKGFSYQDTQWYRALGDEAVERVILPSSEMEHAYPRFRRPVITMAHKVRQIYSRDVVGYLVLYVDLRSFEELLDATMGSSRDFALLDAAGGLIYAKDGGDGAALQMLSGMDGKLLKETLNGLGWQLLYQVDYSGLSDALRGSAALVGYAFLVLLLLIIPIAYYVSTKLTRPFRQMVNGMEQVKQGNYQVQLDARGRNEAAEMLTNFNVMTLRILQLIRQKEYEQKLREEAMLLSLQQQINPHFLYNTLDMIVGMATQGKKDDIIAVATGLAALFRYNIGGRQQASVREEIAHAKKYVTINQHRFQHRFEVQWDIDPAVHDWRIPKFILQPFIENALSHGLGQAQMGGVLGVSVLEDEGALRIRIVDNGAGIGAEELAAIRRELIGSYQIWESLPFGTDDVAATGTGLLNNLGHIGIRNVYARLLCIYGGGLDFAIDSTVGQGTTVAFRIAPLPERGQATEFDTGGNAL